MSKKISKNTTKLKVEVPNYQLEWIEEALELESKGKTIPIGILSQLGQIFLNGVEYN